MRRTRGWTGLRTSVVAFGLVAAAAGVTRADSMKATAPTSSTVIYDTVGSSIGTTGVTSFLTDGDGVRTAAASPATPAITFVPLSGGAFMSPSSLALGMFQAHALGSGQTVTYTDTPFDLKFRVNGFNGVPAVMPDGSPGFQPNETPIDLKGVLNGSMTGANQSNVTATFATPAEAAFATGLYLNTLKVSDNPLSIVPSTSFNGTTTAQAVLTTSLKPAPSAPEPSTILLFGATTAGLAFRRRLRRARAAD
ncbi:MAG: PEP-CTERM sorting domain-containing protein [Planctomycetia bacterium]|nr:PEP-CTERM sorting domain-containing protein [Planctomycetia bacterium]